MPIIPNLEQLTELTKTQRKIFFYLCKNNNNSISNKTIADDIGVEVETVSRAISKLSKAGFLETKYLFHKNGTKRFIKLLMFYEN